MAELSARRRHGPSAVLLAVLKEMTGGPAARAEAAYALFRAGKAGGMAIRDGRVVSAGMFGAVARQIGGLKVRSAIMAAMLVLTAIVIGFATTALFLVVLLALRGLSGGDHVDGQEERP